MYSKQKLQYQINKPHGHSTCLEAFSKLIHSSDSEREPTKRLNGIHGLIEVINEDIQGGVFSLIGDEFQDTCGCFDTLCLKLRRLLGLEN